MAVCLGPYFIAVDFVVVVVVVIGSALSLGYT